MPCARKNEKHIAPPISSASAMSRKRSISATLSVTLAPPSTTTSGRSGDSITPRSVVTSFSSSGPAYDGQVLRDARGRRVRAVGRAERVEHERVGQLGQLLGQLRVVLGLAGLPARVLQHQDLAGLEPRGAAAGLRADHLGRLVDALADQLAEPLRHRRQRRRRVGALRPAQVRAEDDPRARLAQLLDRGQRRADARVVGHLRRPSAGR